MGSEVEDLETLIAPRLAAIGLELVLIEQVTVQGRPTLRVYIDSPQGVGLDECIKANRLLTGMGELDAALTERFDFEVSSPGIERPLTRPEHFERFAGEQAQLKLGEGLSGRKKLTGRIVAVVDGHVEMDVEGARVRVPLADITRARLKPDMETLFSGGSKDGKKTGPRGPARQRGGNEPPRMGSGSSPGEGG